MRWSYQFWVDAPVETIYERALAPERWFTFFKTYRGLESVDARWPEEGSSIEFRFAVVGPWTVRVKQTVVKHERGRRLCLHEEALAGLWIDDVDFSFQMKDGGTMLSIRGNQTSKLPPARLFVVLMYPLNWLSTPRAMRRFKAMIEGSNKALTKVSDEQVNYDR